MSLPRIRRTLTTTAGRIRRSHRTRRLDAGGVRSLAPRPYGRGRARHLSFGPDGTLYVAESDHGGSGPCIASPEGGDAFLGPSGAVTVLDLAAHGNRRIAVTVGLGAPPADRAQLGRSGARLGTLLYGRVGTRLSVKADLAVFEGRHDPDDSGTDSNPTALVRHGSDVVVADAGGNDLLTVASSARVSPRSSRPARRVDGMAGPSRRYADGTCQRVHQRHGHRVGFGHGLRHDLLGLRRRGRYAPSPLTRG